MVVLAEKPSNLAQPPNPDLITMSKPEYDAHVRITRETRKLMEQLSIRLFGKEDVPAFMRQAIQEKIQRMTTPPEPSFPPTEENR